MTRAIAQEIDQIGLFGSGSSPEPRGLLLTSGINTVTSVGTPTDYSKLLTGVQRLLEDNVPLDIATANAIMSPRTWARLEGLATGIASDKTQLPRPRALENTRFLVTTAVVDSFGSPDTGGFVFMGDFRDLLLGIRQEATVEVLKLSTFASSLILEFVATRPASFVVLSGITNT